MTQWINRAKSAVDDARRLADRLLEGARSRWRGRLQQEPAARAHADERTIRRIAEAELGGISSEESVARYARGENPGGLHHKAQPVEPEVAAAALEMEPRGRVRSVRLRGKRARVGAGRTDHRRGAS